MGTCSHVLELGGFALEAASHYGAGYVFEQIRILVLLSTSCGPLPWVHTPGDSELTGLLKLGVVILAESVI